MTCETISELCGWNGTKCQSTFIQFVRRAWMMYITTNLVLSSKFLSIESFHYRSISLFLDELSYVYWHSNILLTITLLLLFGIGLSYERQTVFLFRSKISPNKIHFLCINKIRWHVFLIQFQASLLRKINTCHLQHQNIHSSSRDSLAACFEPIKSSECQKHYTLSRLVIWKIYDEICECNGKYLWKKGFKSTIYVAWEVNTCYCCENVLIYA